MATLDRAVDNGTVIGRALQSAEALGGSVFAFGGAGAHLGLGSSFSLSNDQRSPVQITDLGSDNAYVAAHGQGNLILKTDGTVFSFGNGQNGMLGNGENGGLQNSPAHVTALGSDNALVDCGGQANAVLKTDGTVFIFGYGYERNTLGLDRISGPNQLVPTQITTLGSDNSFVDIGDWHCLVLKLDGTMFGWGKGDFHALGLGSTDFQYSPVALTAFGSDNAQCSAGTYHSIVLKTAGTVFTVGGCGAIGLGSLDVQVSPVHVTTLGSDNALVSAGNCHNLVLKSDGKVFAFGSDHHGESSGSECQLANRGNCRQLWPVQIEALGSDNALVFAGAG